MKNMKINILLLGAAITTFTFSTFAADALLTPRQKDNQAKVTASSINTQGGTPAYVTPGSSAQLSPRARDNQSKVVAGVNKDSNPALACRNNMAGTPKAVGECSSHTTMPGCMKFASAK